MILRMSAYCNVFAKVLCRNKTPKRTGARLVGPPLLDSLQNLSCLLILRTSSALFNHSPALCPLYFFCLENKKEELDWDVCASVKTMRLWKQVTLILSFCSLRLAEIQRVISLIIGLIYAFRGQSLRDHTQQGWVGKINAFGSQLSCCSKVIGMTSNSFSFLT